MALPQSRVVDGCPTILLPGIGCDAELWQPVLGQCRVPFAAQTLVPDGTDVDAMAARILVSAPPRFVLVGHSFGGYVALAIAAQAPQRLLGLGLISTSALADTPRQARRRRLMHALSRVVQSDSRPEWADCLESMSARTGADLQHRQRQAAAGRPDRQAVLASLRFPVSIVHGGEDTIVPVAAAHLMASLLPGAMLTVIPQSGHMLPLQTPSAVAATVDSLVAAGAGQ
jgi:pimeloyl-ACP methyl ester carboxylesterase